jgi:hypothetical protein
MACTQHVAHIETGSRLALDARADQGMRLITLESPIPFDGAADGKTRLPTPRRRCMTTVAKRRPRRLARRKPGNRENLAIIRRDEREIICYE